VATGINSYNTAIAHLGTMWDHAKNASFFDLNTPGSTTHRQLELDKSLVSTELTKAVSNGQMTEGEKNDIEKRISGWTSGSYKDRIKEATELLAGKLDAYDQQWKNGMPSGAVTPIQILSPRAQQTLSMIQGPSQPIYARNPQTGARVMSTDGGKSWQAAQ